MRTRLALILFAAIVAGRTGVSADEYQVLREGLVKSSVKINDVHLPDLVYSIDEQTAKRHFEEYFTAQPFNKALRVNLGYAAFHWGNNHGPLPACSPSRTEQVDQFMTRFVAHPMVLQRLLSLPKTGEVPRLGGLGGPYSQRLIG
ncbi:MAG: hypothetical protein ACYTG0_22040 [Planctomycetota bacterium]|jgi:hypothetical protein